MRVLLNGEEGRVKESNCGSVTLEMHGRTVYCNDSELLVAPSILSQLGKARYEMNDAVRGLHAVCLEAVEAEIQLTSKSDIAKKLRLTPAKLADILKRKSVPPQLFLRIEEMTWRVTVSSVEAWLSYNNVQPREIREIVAPVLSDAEREAQRRYVEGMQTDYDRLYY
jgi:hypothetical protein